MCGVAQEMTSINKKTEEEIFTEEKSSQEFIENTTYNLNRTDTL